MESNISLFYFNQSFCSCKEEQCKNDINSQIKSITGKISLSSMGRLHDLICGLKRSPKILFLIPRVLVPTFGEDASFNKSVIRCILELLAKSEQTATMHLIHDLSHNLHAAWEFLNNFSQNETLNDFTDKLSTEFEVSYIRTIQHATCAKDQGNLEKSCTKPCCVGGYAKDEIINCEKHPIIAKCCITKMPKLKEMLNHVSFMLSLLFEIKSNLSLPSDDHLIEILKAFMSIPNPPLEIIKSIFECILIISRRKPFKTFAAVYNEEVRTKVDLYFHNNMVPLNSVFDHCLKLIGPQINSNEINKKIFSSESSLLLIPPRQIIEYVSDRCGVNDINLYFMGLKVAKRIIKIVIKNDPECLHNTITMYTGLISVLMQDFNNFSKEQQKILLHRIKYIAALIHKKRNETDLSTFTFYKSIINLNHLDIEMVIPTYYSALNPFLAEIFKKDPSLVSKMRLANLLKFTSTMLTPGGTASKRKKLELIPEHPMNSKQLKEFMYKISYEISMFHHYAYEDAINTLFDLLELANTGNINAISLSILLLYRYDKELENLFIDNFSDLSGGIINDQFMLLKCAKLLFRSSNSAKLTNASTGNLSFLINIQETVTIPDSVLRSRITEGLLLHDVFDQQPTIQYFESKLEPFIQSLWKKDDKLERYLAYSGSLYGLMSKYIKFTGCSIAGSLTLFVDRIEKIAEDKTIQAERFVNYVDTVCYILMNIICKLHKLLAKSSSSVSQKKSEIDKKCIFFKQKIKKHIKYQKAYKQFLYKNIVIIA